MINNLVAAFVEVGVLQMSSQSQKFKRNVCLEVLIYSQYSRWVFWKGM